MNAEELRPVLTAALRGWAGHEETLRELDAALGDGDLGITVRSGAGAAADAIDAAPADATLSTLLGAAGRAFATANPSTFAALVGGGVMAGAKAVGTIPDDDRHAASAAGREGVLTRAASADRGTEPVEGSAGERGYTRDDAVAFGRTVAQRIQERGKAELGDKTLLDALLPSLDALTEASGGAADLCRIAAGVAHERVAETAAWESKRGRAGWLGERSVGHADAGSTAYALLLDELATAFEAHS